LPDWGKGRKEKTPLYGLIKIKLFRLAGGRGKEIKKGTFTEKVVIGRKAGAGKR